jgi:hypothetical protein
MKLALKLLTIRRTGQVLWRVKGLHHCGPASQLRHMDVSVPMPQAVMEPGVPDGMFYGIDRSVRHYYMPVNYVAVMACAPQLDQRGFLFDQAGVDTFLNQLAQTPTDKSCERLAQYAAEQLLEHIAFEVPTCQVRAMTMTLSPSPFVAEVTASYAPSRSRKA